MAARLSEPVLALFPWGETIEEFLDPIGLDLRAFAEDMSGGWLFGYVAALQTVGWRSVIVCGSTTVSRPTRWIHRGTGAAIWAVPARRTPVELARRRPSRASLGHWWNAPWRGFAGVLRRERCTAILAQEYEYARLEVLRTLGRLRRLPVYASFQGGDWTASKLEARLRTRSIAGCAGLIVASSTERARLQHAYGAALPPITSIPNPLDTQAWSPQSRGEARKHLDLPADAFLVVCHGRIDIRRKGLDLMLAAWTRFSRMRPDARLVLIGSGQDAEEFGRMLGAADCPSIHWQSSYTNDRALMRRWLSAADLYLSCSRVEGMPVAPLEAMAMGLPVICTAAQGIADILDRGEDSGGVMVAVDDVDAVMAALQRLASDTTLRDRLGQAARSRVTSAFSIEAVGAALGAFITPAAHAAVDRG